MQKAETSTVDAQKTEEKKNIKKLIEISMDDAKMIYVNWPTDKKDVCLIALCEALKLVSTYQRPEIVRAKPNIMDFVRGIKR